MEEVTQPRTTYRYYDPSTITIKDIYALRRQVHSRYKNKLEFLHAIPYKKTMEEAEAIGTTIYHPDDPCPYHNRYTAVLKTKYGWSHACCVSAYNQKHTVQLEQLPHSYVLPVREEVEEEYAAHLYELDQLYKEKATAKTKPKKTEEKA